MEKKKSGNNSPPESWEQEQVFIWIRANQIKYPKLQLAYATLNGVRLSPLVMAKAKGQGNRKGVSDIVLPARSADRRHSGLYLELKRYKGGKLSKEQEAFLLGVMAEGYKAVIARGHREAINELKQYLGINQEAGLKAGPSQPVGSLRVARPRNFANHESKS